MHRVSLFFIFFVFVGCSRKAAPSIVYQDVITTKYDTITDFSFSGYDTIYSYTPCDSFIRVIKNNDTVYIKEVKVKLVTKYVNKRDTIYRQPIINNPQANIKTVAKKGSIIGNDNTMTTKKNNWWWIFLAGILTWFIIQNVLFRVLKTYFPFLRIFP